MTDRILYLKRHLCKGLVEAIRLEDRVPAKRVITSGRNNAAIAAAIKYNRFSVRTLTEGKDALCICCLIIKVLHHLPETLTAHTIQEIFDIGARKAIVGVKAETNVFGKNWRVAFGSCQFYFVLGDLLRFALDLH